MWVQSTWRQHKQALRDRQRRRPFGRIETIFFLSAQLHASAGKSRQARRMHPRRDLPAIGCCPQHRTGIHRPHHRHRSMQAGRAGAWPRPAAPPPATSSADRPGDAVRRSARATQAGSAAPPRSLPGQRALTCQQARPGHDSLRAPRGARRARASPRRQHLRRGSPSARSTTAFNARRRIQAFQRRHRPAKPGSNRASAPHSRENSNMRDGRRLIKPLASSCHTRSATSVDLARLDHRLISAIVSAPPKNPQARGETPAAGCAPDPRQGIAHDDATAWLRVAAAAMRDR